MLKLRIKYYFIIFFIISITVHVSGDKIDASEIIINSDDLTYDKIKNVASFEGEVIMWFDDLILKTTNIKIFYKQVAGKNKIDRIVIPNKLKALQQKNQNILIADTAVYSFDKNELSLESNVMLLHDDNILKTDKLIFVTELKKIDNKND